MATKCVTITTEAYERLARMKAPSESFTDVIIRLTKPKGSLLDLVGILPKERVDEIEKHVLENRRRHRESYTRRVNESRSLIDDT